MNKELIEEIEKLLMELIDSPTKADAKSIARNLETKRMMVCNLYCNNASYKLSEAISSAESASGRVADKEHHRLRALMHLSTFKNIVAID